MISDPKPCKLAYVPPKPVRTNYCCIEVEIDGQMVIAHVEKPEDWLKRAAEAWGYTISAKLV